MKKIDLTNFEGTADQLFLSCLYGSEHARKKAEVSNMGSLQMKDSNREAFDEWHYEQYLLENPNIDISNAKYIYDYAHKNVLVFQLRESHFTAWQAAKAQAVQEWISVEDNLPNRQVNVLVASKHDFLCIASLTNNHKNNKFYDGDGFAINSITHWMPLPISKPPKAQEPTDD